MDVEQQSDTSGELSKESAVVALTGLLEKMFSATLVVPALSQIGLTIGDRLRFFRMKNLLSLNRRLGEVLEQRNLRESDVKSISLAVGLPLLEKASYQDDTVLQSNWANLLASAMEGSGNSNDGFDLEITYIEILHQFSRLDCDVLEYIATNGVQERKKDTGEIVPVALDPINIRNAFPGKRAHISLEKLVNLGCAYRVLRATLTREDRGDGYGAWPQDIVVTLVGLNLYIAASGKKPKWYYV